MEYNKKKMTTTWNTHDSVNCKPFLFLSNYFPGKSRNTKTVVYRDIRSHIYDLLGHLKPETPAFQFFSPS